MNDRRRKIAVLGATGSIGKSTASVIAEHPDLFQVTAIAAHSSVDEIIRQAKLFSPSVVALTGLSDVTDLQSQLGSETKVLTGENSLMEIATSDDVDILLCAIVGTAGIAPVLAAIECGKTIALASKEVMVSAGDLVNAALKKNPAAKLLPVDSEHSGVFQCLDGRDASEIHKIWLTASGGPFRTWTPEAIQNATLAQALAHPTWSMGRKITIDSASMMNKALEIVEARYLFGVSGKQIDVIINPQSVIHALVEFTDRTFVAQMATPDMRMPIAYALNYPQRTELAATTLDLAKMAKIELYAPDKAKFPSFDFAYAAIEAGGTLPGAMNAANEIAVERFVRNEIKFGDIWKIVGHVMDNWHNEPQSSFEQLSEADTLARIRASEYKVK